MNWSALLWIVLLLLANGFFVASEFAYLMARRNVLEARGTLPTRAALRLIDDLTLSLTAAQLGITMASLLLGFVAEPAIATILERALGFLGMPDRVLHALALTIALLIVVFLHMVVGEMAPKNIVIAAPEQAALVMAVPFRGFIIVFRPVIWLLNETANLVLRLLRTRPVSRLDVAYSAEDLATIISSGRREGVIEDFAHRLLTGAIMFRERDVSDVMVARPDVKAVTVEATVGEIEQAMEATGHSRLLVHTGDLDDVRGFVHVKDLLEGDYEARDVPLEPSVVRPLLVVPEMARLRTVLASMRRTHNHLALVVDEHGGTAGIVTLRDIVEQLVGGARGSRRSSVQVVRAHDGERFIAAGSVRPGELEDIGVDLPEGDYETIGGLVMERLGRIPRNGDVVEAGDYRIRVVRMDRHRVGQVEISRLSPDA
ncbi:MAG: HlyC/CorC family transporter [Acidimicrobiia bacterium]|nr:HlyC/CorC family transporter [Acidimicrobiia bacterium]